MGLGSDDAQHEGAHSDCYVFACVIAPAVAIDIAVMVAAAPPMTPRSVTSDVMAAVASGPAISAGSGRKRPHGGGGERHSDGH